MNVLAINGCHHKGKNTANMLNIVLEEAKAEGADTELLEITDFNRASKFGGIALYLRIP